MKVRLIGDIGFVYDIEAENIKDAKNKFYKLLSETFLDNWFINYNDNLIKERTEELNQKPKYEDDDLLPFGLMP